MASNLVVNGFAGPGGWCQALRELGLPSVGLELDAAACATRAAAGHLTIRTDVTQYPTAPFRGRISGKIDSPVCTPFSRAGKGGGIRDLPLVHQAVHDLAQGRDTRAQLRAACTDPVSILAAEPMRWHHDLRPEWIAMEQVPDVLPLWQQYAGILRGWGYSVWTGVVNAANHGVPQTRQRAVLAASRTHAVTAPEATHAEAPADPLFGPRLERWVSMADALGLEPGLTVNTRGERRTPGGNEFSADSPCQGLTGPARSLLRRESPPSDAPIPPGAPTRPCEGLWGSGWHSGAGSRREAVRNPRTTRDGGAEPSASRAAPPPSRLYARLNAPHRVSGPRFVRTRDRPSGARLCRRTRSATRGATDDPALLHRRHGDPAPR